MMFSAKKHFVHILVAVALVLSTVSPACKFISGKSQFMEICSDYGIKVIPVPDGYEAPQVPAKENHKEKSNGCDFCFAQAHFGKLISPPPAIPAAINQPSILIAVWDQKSYARPELHSLSARAPPVIL